MSTFKATNKKKKSDNDVFKATSRRTYDTAYIGGIESQANESWNILNEYLKKRENGSYVSSKDMDTYEKAFKTYSSNMSTLNGIYKTFRKDYNEEETNNLISTLSDDIKKSKKTFSKFKDENEYNDAVKIGELNAMPTDKIKPHIDSSKSATKEIEKKIADLNAEWSTVRTRMQGYERGHLTYTDKYKSDKARVKEIEAEINSLKEGKTASNIAYTTSGGQNITWSSLYNKKKYEEDFNSLYNEMSANPDWAEHSQYKPTYDKSNGETVFNASDIKYERANFPNISVNGAEDTYYALQTEEKEKELFNYLAHTKGTDYALDWLMSNEDVYKERQHTQNIKYAQQMAEKVPVLSDAIAVAGSLVSPFEYLGNALTGNMGERTMSADISSAIKGTRMEQIDWEVGNWDVFDFLYGTGTSMAESALAMTTFGGLGGVSLGLSAAAQSTNDALDRGMSKGQAFASGVASGIFEGLFESWQIGAFGDLTKNLKRADFRNIAKYVGKNMWNNAKEETLTEIANMAYDTLINGEFSQYETAIRQHMNTGMSEADAKLQVAKELGIQVAEAAGSGALMGFGFGAIGGAKVRHNITQSGKAIKVAGETRNLVDLGKSLGEGTKSYEYANKITDKSRGLAISKLLGIVEGDIANANKGDIVKSLERKGYDTEKANNIADLMLDPENTMFANSRGISAPGQTYNDIINNPNSTVSQRNETYEGILRGVAENRTQKAKGTKTKVDSKPVATSQGVLPLASDYVEKRTEQLVASGIPIEQAKQVAQGEFAENQSKMSTRTEKAVESKFESNTEGKDFDTASGKIIVSKKLVSSAKDDMAFEVTYDDGTTETVDAKNISFGNDGEALVYSTVMDMNVPLGVAESLIGGYKGNDIKTAATYINGIREAFKFGKYNQEADLNNGQYASQLTDEQRNSAFKLGRIYANEKAIADTKAIVGESKPTDIKKREGKVHFEGDKLSLKSVQEESIENLKVLTMAIGKDIHIFESYVENGRRVYKDANGNIKKAPNGFYDQKDGSIWIDLNAGRNGEGTMMFTVAHELTHFIKQWSPTKFKALADFLVEQYGKEGVSVHQLVLDQQAKAKKNGRPDMSYDTAFEEMVADSMETMLTDGKVIRELAHRDKGLFDKIKSWIDNLLRRLNKEYKNYSPETKEGQMLREMKKTFEEAQRLFAEALTEASDNFAIRGTDVGFIKQNMITETGKLAGIMDSTRTETEAMPKMVMDMSSGNGGKLFTDLATSHLIKGIGEGKAVNGYTVAQIREAIMKANGYNTKEIRNVQSFMKSMADFMNEAGVKYRFIGLKDVENAKLHYSYNADGSIKSVVLSAMVKNGDYPVNFDFSSICKKRVAMSKLINKLCDVGAMDKGTVNLSPKNIFEINKALKNEGFETACLGCFVESKRYNIQEWANSFIKKWNEAVLKVNPNATYFGFTDGKTNFDNLTSSQVFAIDKAAQTFLNKTGQERRNKAKAVYEEKAKNGEALLEKLPKSAIEKIKKSQSLDDSMKDYFLSTDPKAFTLADVELLIDNEIIAGKSISNKQKISKMVESGEQFQHLLRPSDLLTERGVTQLEQLPNFHGILYGHYGSGTPKLVQGFTPYNSEIALLSEKKGDKTLAEYLYSIAGVRMQSFSDFQIQNIFDYLQMIADLSARKLPAHAYTKEISFAKLLGMTGIKTNLSVMFDIDTSVDDAHAGLAKYNPAIHQGEYAKIVLEDEQGKWVYNIGDYATQKAYEDYAKMMGNKPVKRFLQSIGFADAVKLQTTEGYTKNCGIIGVGYSDAHIRAMLDDSRIRYVIPYHSSSLPHEIKVATNIEKGTDYTSTQNTMKIVRITDKNGNEVNWSIKEAYKRLNSGKAVIEELNKHIKEDGWVVETKKAQNGHGTYDLYGDLSNTSDPRMTADNFMSWCAKNGSLPLFYQFADHNNYYKMLYDFNVYDNVTEEYAPQGAVTNTYPTGANIGENVVDGNFNDGFFKETVEHYMQVQNDFNARLDDTVDRIADDIVNNTMPDADFGVLNSDRDSAYMDAVNNGDMETAQRLVEEVAKASGYTQKLYHGTNQFGFTKFEGTEGHSYDEIQFFTTDSLETANTYSGTNKVRGVSEDYELDYDIEDEYEEQARDIASDMAGFMSGEIGYYGYIDGDYIIDAFKSANEDKLVEIEDEWLWDIYKGEYSDEYEEFYEFEESEECENLVNKFHDYAGQIKSIYKALNHYETSGIYEFFANTDNLFVIDGKGKHWNALEDSRLPDRILNNGGKGIKLKYKTRDVCLWAKEQGYSGVLFKNIVDSGSGQNVSPANVYAFFNPREQVKSADPITYDNNGNVIPLSQRFNKENDDIRYSERIEADMSEEERYEILKDKKIQPQEIEIDKDFDIEFSFLENNIKSVVEKTLVPKLRELGYLKKYKTTVVDVDFEFTGRGTSKSLHSQENHYGGNLGDFAKVVLNMQKLLDNSVLLEIHTDKGKGTPRENSRLVQTYVLLSAFRDGNAIKPVQFEVKQYIDNNNRLYLAVALTKIETGVKGNTAPQNEGRTYLLPVSTISLADLFKKVNIKDAKLLKYAPNQFLNEEQIKAKEKELEEDREKYSIKESIRVANTELASMDDTALYIKNTKKANYIGMIFNGTKTEETRSRRTLDAFIGKDFYVTDGEKVYGTIVLGEPHKYTEEEFHKLENQKKHRVPKGDEYDVKPGGSKWAYPIESYERFNKPKKLSDSKEYMNSFQARQVLYSERDDTSVSTRTLLANALEGTAVKPEERNLLRNYKTNLRLIDGEQAKLDKVREEYNEIKYKKSLSIGEDKLSIAEFEKRAKDLAEKQGQDAEKVKFKLDRSNSKYIAYVGDVVKGQILSADKSFRTEEDAEKLQKLSQEAKLITTRINSYDRELFKLENMKPLKDVLTREKELARKRQKQKDAENLREYKEKVAKTTRELLDRNRESRYKAIEGRNKTKMRHKVKKIVNDLNNLLLKPTKERHVPEEMRVAVAEALAIINMDTVDAETRVARLNEKIAMANDPDVIASLTESRDRILNQGNKLGEKLDKLKNAYGMIKASSDGLTSSLYDDVIYSKIESVQKIVGKTALRNMTLEQLNNVYDLYEMVLTTVRDSNKAFAENITMTRQALGSNTFEEIKENNKAKDRIRFEGVKKFGWKYLKPMLAMKTIGSETLQKLWNNILYGQEVFAQDYDEAVKFAKETKEKYGYDKWDLLKQYSFESKSGKVMKINLEQMMSIYAYSKRKQADEHIEFGGILLNESIIKEKNKLGKIIEVKVNDSTAYRLDKMQVGEIIATLEKEFPGAKDFVDEMQKYLSETMGEKGNEVSMKMYGIKLFKEEHYFPLKSSKEFMEAANAKLKGDVKIKNKGMTKSTVEHARNPIVLEGFLNVWGNHINEMAMYHGLVLPLEDFSRTLNYSFKADEKLNTDAESVKTALGSAFGESAENYLNELLKAINGGVLHDSSDGFANKMISNFKKSKVMASLSVIVQQPTAIIRAMGIIDPKYFVAQNFHHKTTWEELKKYCPTAIIKETGSFDTNMGRTIVDMIKEDRKFTEKVGDALGKAPAYMDEMGWNMIWRALKKKVATEQNLSGEELLKECGRQMTLIINETQVYDSVMSRNELMRSKNALTKMATAFMGEPTTVANMIYGAALDFKRGKKGMAGKTIAAVISSVVVNGLVSSLVYAIRDDDEEKTFLEKYLSSATTEVIDGFNPLTYIPFVKDAYSLSQGYDVERTDMALIGDVVDALDDFYNVLDPEAYEGLSRKEIAKHIYENAKPLLTSICDMFGLPVGNILRDAEAIIVNDNLPLSKTSSEGSGLAMREGWINSSPKFVQKFFDDGKYHKLYLKANNGDSAYVKNEVAEMVAEKFDSFKKEEDSEVKAEKKAKQSVKASFTDTYRDEYKKAFKKKDANEMNRIRKFLYATGLWVSLRELDNLLTKWREEA